MYTLSVSGKTPEDREAFDAALDGRDLAAERKRADERAMVLLAGGEIR